jgi:hypothetical protein
MLTPNNNTPSLLDRFCGTSSTNSILMKIDPLVQKAKVLLLTQFLFLER